MDIRKRLIQKLRLLAGIPPYADIDSYLDDVIGDINRIARSRTPTTEDWVRAAERHIPGTGKFFYGGEDFSDLNRLLMLLQNSRPGGSGSGAVRK
jgi:hypothetical protein